MTVTLGKKSGHLVKKNGHLSVCCDVSSQFASVSSLHAVIPGVGSPFPLTDCPSTSPPVYSQSDRWIFLDYCPGTPGGSPGSHVAYAFKQDGWYFGALSCDLSASGFSTIINYSGGAPEVGVVASSIVCTHSITSDCRLALTVQVDQSFNQQWDACELYCQNYWGGGSYSEYIYSIQASTRSQTKGATVQFYGVTDPGPTLSDGMSVICSLSGYYWGPALIANDGSYGYPILSGSVTITLHM